jgi:hypothetical protein
MKPAGPLPILEPDILLEVVQQALQQEVLDLVEPRTQLLSGGWEATTSLYEVSGHARTAGEPVAWALILKVLRPTDERLDPGHWNYWLREPLAYQSGLLGPHTGGITAPECYDVVERPDGTIWLWLEKIIDRVEPEWPLSAYGIAARQLGYFNGLYLTSRPLPTGPWVSQGWLRSYVTEYAPIVQQLPELQGNSLVRPAVPPHLLTDLLRLCGEQDTFLNALDRLPQTFCHLDAWRWNLFITHDAHGQPQTVAVDWAFSGIGAAGQELAPLIFSNYGTPEMEEYALRHYLEGLYAAGWQGEEWQVRLGYSATLAFEYGLAAVGFFVGALLDESQHAALEAGFSLPVDQVATRFTPWVEFALPRAEQARALLQRL